MSVARVEYHLGKMVEAFDVTKLVEGSPFPFAHDITDAARPIAVAGSMGLVKQGEHREAVYWIVVTMARCLAMLRTEGQDEQADGVESDLRELLEELGITSFEDFAASASSIREYLPELRSTAQNLTDRI